MRLTPSTLLSLVLLLPLGCPGDDGNADTSPTTGDDVVDTTTATADTTTDTSGEGGYCTHQCSMDADCTIDGQDIGQICQTGTCTVPDAGCTDDADCVATYSEWTVACTAGGGECDALMQVCVQFRGGGLCAMPSDSFMCDMVPGWSEIEITDIDGNSVTVCGNPNAECNAEGFCFSPCQSDADCSSDVHPICNINTGICECSSDANCAILDGPAVSVCNAGVCGCGSDQSCIDGNAGDICNADGTCGCSSSAVCTAPNLYDGGTITCASP